MTTYFVKRIISKKIAYDVFIPSRIDNRNGFFGIFLLPGIPSYPAKNSCPEILSGGGFLVVVPHYIGTWDSTGHFSLSGCIKTAIEGWKLVHSKSFLSKFFGNKKIYVIDWIFGGNSFGGTIAMAAVGENIKNVDTLLLIAPATSSYYNADSTLSILNYLKANYPETYQIKNRKSFINEFAKNNLEKVIRSNFLKYCKKTVLVYGGKDKTVFPSMVEKWLAMPGMKANNFKKILVKKADHQCRNLLAKKTLRIITEFTRENGKIKKIQAI